MSMSTTFVENFRLNQAKRPVTSDDVVPEPIRNIVKELELNGTKDDLMNVLVEMLVTDKGIDLDQFAHMFL